MAEKLSESDKENLINDARNNASQAILDKIAGDNDKAQRSELLAATKANALGYLDNKEDKNPFNPKDESQLFRQYESGKHGAKNPELEMMTSKSNDTEMKAYANTAKSYMAQREIDVKNGNHEAAKDNLRDANLMAMTLGARFDTSNPFNERESKNLNKFFEAGREERETKDRQEYSVELILNANKMNRDDAINVYPKLNEVHQYTDQLQTNSPKIDKYKLENVTKLAIANMVTWGKVGDPARHVEERSKSLTKEKEIER